MDSITNARSILLADGIKHNQLIVVRLTHGSTDFHRNFPAFYKNINYILIIYFPREYKFAFASTVQKSEKNIK